MIERVPIASRWLGPIFAALTLFLWGTLPVILKLLLLSLDPFTATWYRFLFASVLLMPFIAYRYGLASPFRVRGKALALAAACVLGLCANYLTYMMGLQRISPSSAQVVMQLSPILVLLGGLIVFKEPFSRLQWFGFGVLIIGMLLFFNQRYAELFSTAANYAQGIWLVFAAAVFWAIFILAQKPLLHHLPSVSIMALVYWFGSVSFLPLAQPDLVLDLPTMPLVLLVCSVLFTLVSYLSFAETMKRMEASRVGALIALGPLVTLTIMGLLSMTHPGLVPSHPHNEIAIFGAVLVVIGSMCSSLGKSPSAGGSSGGNARS